MHEIENGVRRLTKKVGRRKPVEEYLRLQTRFRHVLEDPEALAEIQRDVDERFDALVARMTA